MELQPKQRLFLESDADQVLFGGAVGGGKSFALLAWSIRRRKQYPGTHGLLLRRTMPELQLPGSLIPKSRELLTGVAEWSEGHSRWRFPCGGTITFGSCQHPGDQYQYLSSEFADIGFDEATTFTVEQLSFITSRCRVAGRPEVQPQVRYATNPGGASGYWFRSEFVEAAPAGEIFTARMELAGRTVTVRRQYLPSTLEDNRYLDPEQYLIALSGLSPQHVEALVKGLWVTLDGAMYPEFEPKRHVVEPMEIPAGWRWYVGIDHGFNNPCGIVWGAVSPDGVMYVVWQERVRHYEVPDLCALIKETNEQLGARPAVYGAGPDIFVFSNRPGGPTIAEEYRRNGIPVVDVCPGALGKRHRYSALRRYLAWKHPSTQEAMPGRPLLRIMARPNRAWLQQQIQESQVDGSDPEVAADAPADSSGRGGDDVLDACTHLAMARPVAPVVAAAPPPVGSAEWMRRQARRRAQGLPDLPFSVGDGS